MSAIVRLAVRSLLGRARVLVLLALALSLLGLALVVRLAGAGDLDPAGSPLTLVTTFGIGVVVPVATLLGTTTLISSEVDDGSIIYLLSKPVPRWAIIAGKSTVILAGAMLFAAIPMALAALIMVGAADDLWWGALLAGATAAVAYTGVFTLLTTLFKRSAMGCLLYWLIWESLLTTVLKPAEWLSAGAHGESVVRAAVGLEAHPPVWFAILASTLASALGIVLAGQRLARTTISEV